MGRWEPLGRIREQTVCRVTDKLGDKISLPEGDYERGKQTNSCEMFKGACQSGLSLASDTAKLASYFFHQQRFANCKGISDIKYKKQAKRQESLYHPFYVGYKYFEVNAVLPGARCCVEGQTEDPPDARSSQVRVFGGRETYLLPEWKWVGRRPVRWRGDGEGIRCVGRRGGGRDTHIMATSVIQ